MQRRTLQPIKLADRLSASLKHWTFRTVLGRIAAYTCLDVTQLLQPHELTDTHEILNEGTLKTFLVPNVLYS